jgi:DNA-directed RNA polymerase subunit L
MPPLTFEWSECGASHVNALRRVIIAEMPVLVCRRSDCTVVRNTSRFTNEIIAERLASFIPHSVNPEHIGHIVHLNVANKGKDPMYVTTESLAVGTPAGAAVPGLFPPLEIRTPEGKLILSHHLLLRLRPGEEVELRCPISRALTGESGQYSVASTATYWCVRDSVASEAAYEALPEDEKGPERKENWNKLEANRFVVPGKFMFSVQTSSVYTNQELIATGCNILLTKLDGTAAVSQKKSSDTAIPNCTDVILRNTDYTIGKLLESELYIQREKLGVTFVVFFKHHPHDEHGVLRVATVDDKTNVADLLLQVTEPIKRVFFKILQGPGQNVLHPKLREAFSLFKRADVDEKRRRLRELGVPQEILKATDEEGLDMIVQTYLNRGELSAKPSLLNVKEGAASSHDEAEKASPRDEASSHDTPEGETVTPSVPENEGASSAEASSHDQAPKKKRASKKKDDDAKELKGEEVDEKKSDEVPKTTEKKARAPKKEAQKKES